jgi:oligosaccharide repeat unit polymerase
MLCLGLVAVLAAAFNSQVLSFFAFWALFAFPCFLSTSDKKLDVFRPCVGLSILLLVYSLSALLFLGEAGVDYYGNQPSAVDVTVFMAATLLATLGISVGAWWPRVLIRRTRRGGVPGAVTGIRAINISAISLGVLFIWAVYDRFLPWMATTYGEIALTSRIEASANVFAGPTEILTNVFPETLIICAAVQILFDRHQAAVVRGAAVILFVAYTFTMLLSGWRGQMMLAVLTLGMYFHYRVRAITIGRAAVMAVCVYMIINLMSVARVSSNPVEMARAVLEEFDSRGVAFISIANSGELATSTNLLTLIEGIRSGSTDFKYGSLAASQVISFLPRGVSPDRPGFGSEQFTQVFFPNVAAMGGGVGFFFPQDGYWDYGLIGVFIYSVFFSVILELLYIKFRANAYSNLALFFYALAYSQLVMTSVRGGMFAALKGALIVCSPLLIPWLLSRCAVSRSPEADQARGGAGR